MSKRIELGKSAPNKLFWRFRITSRHPQVMSNAESAAVPWPAAGIANLVITSGLIHVNLSFFVQQLASFKGLLDETCDVTDVLSHEVPTPPAAVTAAAGKENE